MLTNIHTLGTNNKQTIAAIILYHYDAILRDLQTELAIPNNMRDELIDHTVEALEDHIDALIQDVLA